MRVLLALLALLTLTLTLALGCTKPTGACTSASDCAVICYENDRDCCGDMCGCQHAFPKAEAERIARERNEHCARKDLACPEAKCLMKTYEPSCVEGKCVAVLASGPPGTSPGAAK